MAPESWADWVAAARADTVPQSPSHLSDDLTAACLVRGARISCCGCPWTQPEAHFWLARVPGRMLKGLRLCADGSHPHRILLASQADASSQVEACDSVLPIERATLNLELPPPAKAQAWLHHMRDQQLIWDPDPARVSLLRALALPVLWLDPASSGNHWLHQAQAGESWAWARQLGLAPPTDGSLMVLGPGGETWDRALAAEARLLTADNNQLPAIDYVPGWPLLTVGTVSAALAQAGWLRQVAQVCERIVLIGEAGLPMPQHLLSCAQPIWSLQAPLTPGELRDLHCGRWQMAPAEERPAREVEHLFHWSDPARSPSMSVLVSLFNYGERIDVTLDAVAAQTQTDLELIVVDDSSSDGGDLVVKRWMENHAGSQRRFQRLSLLRHHSNGGLASARNTGFAAAVADWCFVLDADNVIYPRALERCLALTEDGGERLAVVHPLLLVEADSGVSDPRSLVGPAPWQRDQFLQANPIDAMALVSRRAWREVGGITHIEGGWEDFDFWCKLVDRGFHGLQCSEILAVYRAHASSMSNTCTNRSWRALSATLQARHPWLQLPLAPPLRSDD